MSDAADTLGMYILKLISQIAISLVVGLLGGILGIIFSILVTFGTIAMLPPVFTDILYALMVVGIAGAMLYHQLDNDKIGF